MDQTWQRWMLGCVMLGAGVLGSVGAVPARAARDCDPVGHVIAPRSEGKIDALAAAGRGDVWAVGGREIVQWRSGPHTSYSSKLYAAHWMGSAWTPVLPPDLAPYGAAGEFLGVAALGANDVWAVGDTTFTPSGTYGPLAAHWDGRSWRWTAVAETGIKSLAAVAGSGPADVWAVGQGIIHWDGGTWRGVALPGGVEVALTGVVALSPTDAWVVGSTLAVSPKAVLDHWDGTTWTVVAPAVVARLSSIRVITAAGPDDIWIGGEFGSAHWDGTQWRIVALPTGAALTALTVRGPGDVWAADAKHLFHLVDGGWRAVRGPGDTTYGALAVEWPGDVWAGGTNTSGSGTPTSGDTSYAQRFVHTFSPCSVPTAQQADPRQEGVAYFAPTGHTLRGPFRAYWEAHGGLAQFGYPLTEVYSETNPTDGQVYQVQYFERNRFELHPEHAGTPYEVLLGLLGRTISADQAGTAPFQPLAAAPPAPVPFFPATGHTLAPEFADYWHAHGGLAVYGYPISEPFTEVSATDGKPYTVQYFERNRLEYHPALPAAFRVSLGLLGGDILRDRGWTP